MAKYTRPVQFVTSDGLDFFTGGDENLIVTGEGYFWNTKNRQENLNTIAFGDYTFKGNKIKSLKLHFESGLLADQLAIDTVTAEVISDTKPTVTRYTPITVKRGTTVMGVFFNGQVKDIGKKKYRIYAESYISLLDYTYHYGGVYSGTTTGAVIAELMGTIPYTIDNNAAAIKLYGYLPYATKRENLLQILIATGATITRNADGTINVSVLANTSTGTFGNERVFLGGSAEEETKVTALNLTEHAYVQISDEATLVSESFTGIKIITFSEPYHDFICTNGTILASGANYAKIQGAGAVVLTGKKYRHTTKILTQGTVLNTPDDKIVSVSNATLVTAINSSFVAKRLYAYATCNKTIKQDVLVNAERTGNVVKVIHPYSTDYLNAVIQSLDFNLSNTMRADAEFLIGYTPQGISEGYKNRVLITANGNWTVPTGVTEIRCILVGGGAGGNAGTNGTDGSRGVSSQSLNRGAAGKGGKAGSPGLAGKVLDIALSVTPGQVLSAVIGVGGLSNGALGASGTATTFGASSSANGVTGEYVDVMTADKYAIAGNVGIDGGDGAGNSTGTGDNITTTDGITYNGGSPGSTEVLKVSSSLTVGARGGAGGGAAYGSNGGNSGNGHCSNNSGLGFATGGPGGSGANAIAANNATLYGSGGDGGSGGGGGGGGGDCYNPNGSSYEWSGYGGNGGIGGAGGDGADGCIIIYY